MASEREFEHTVDLSRMTLSPVSDALIEKYGLPTESAGVVITAVDDAGAAKALEGGVISRIQSNSYELFVYSPDDVSRGITKMKSFGDETAQFRFSNKGDAYGWLRVAIDK
ncbi:MAG: hypothetical protein ACR2PM_05520 [Hyphomicrobiales bacterium]